MNQIMTQNNKSNGLQVLGMKINSLTEAMQMADFFAKSDLVPKDYRGKPGNIVVAWQKGYEVGLMPQQSLETIAVINGRACIWGDGLIALIRNSPKEEWTNEWIEGSGDNRVAICETKRVNTPKPIRGTFSITQAKTARLWGNNTWAKYPERMLQMRARAFCLRDAYPDVLNGLQLAEEQEDAQRIQYVNNIDEIEQALQQYGLSLIKDNGIATVQGKTFEHSKMLKELNFEFVENQWIVHYEKVMDAEVVQQQTQQQTQQQNPARELLQFLKDNGLDSSTAGKFVKEKLKLSSADKEGCSMALENKDVLLEQVKQFLNPIPEIQSDDVEDIDGLF